MAQPSFSAAASSHAALIRSPSVPDLCMWPCPNGPFPWAPVTLSTQRLFVTCSPSTGKLVFPEGRFLARLCPSGSHALSYCTLMTCWCWGRAEHRGGHRDAPRETCSLFLAPVLRGVPSTQYRTVGEWVAPPSPMRQPNAGSLVALCWVRC